MAADETAGYGGKAVLRQGWLLKQSRFIQDWRRRWIVLTDSALLSYKNPAAQVTIPTESLSLAECNSVKSADGVGHKFAFRVDTPDRVFFLVATNTGEKEAWIGAIGKQMVHINRTNVFTEEDVVY